MKNLNLNGIYYLYYENEKKEKSYDKDTFLVIKDLTLIYYSRDKVYTACKINKKTHKINNLQSTEYSYNYNKGILTFDNNSYIKKEALNFKN